VLLFSPNGKNEKDDKNRVDAALQTTGHATKTPSRFVNSDSDTVIDGIMNFQRQNQLQIDGAVNPGGPTERMPLSRIVQAEKPKLTKRPTPPTRPTDPSE